jgi:hypothetical protein
MLINTVAATPIIQVAGENIAQIEPARARPQNFFFKAHIPPIIAVIANSKTGKIKIQTVVDDIDGPSSAKYPDPINLLNIIATANHPNRCKNPPIMLNTPPAIAFQLLSIFNMSSPRVALH